MKDRFDISGKVFLITGGTGLLGYQHAAAISEKNGIPVLLDTETSRFQNIIDTLQDEFNSKAFCLECDVTSEVSIKKCYQNIIEKYGRIDGLINNAAINTKMQVSDKFVHTKLEDLSLESWQNDFNVSVTGAFLCSRIFGGHMADNEGGVIINISSDLGIIAPDQRIYFSNDKEESAQVVKPVTYSVTKHALIGLTKYLATYWAHKGVRSNALCPGGVFSGQSKEIVKRLKERIPLGRMAEVDEYRGAIQFLCSDASRYMNGSSLVLDGGRTVW